MSAATFIQDAADHNIVTTSPFSTSIMDMTNREGKGGGVVFVCVCIYIRVVGWVFVQQFQLQYGIYMNQSVFA